MPNYQNSKVYSIRSLSRPELIYVGSTTQTLSKRMGEHRSTNSNCVSKEIINIGDAYIELIENYPCVDKNQLLARENRYMRGIDCLNKRSAIADCPHGKIQNYCVECHGSQICEHNKKKSTCIPCGGSAMCIHNKQKSQCISCGGSAICIHNKKKSDCKICSPIICERCNTTISKGSYTRHLKSQKHIENNPENLI